MRFFFQIKELSILALRDFWNILLSRSWDWTLVLQFPLYRNQDVSHTEIYTFVIYNISEKAFSVKPIIIVLKKWCEETFLSIFFLPSLFSLVLNVYCLKYPHAKECSTKSAYQNEVKSSQDEARYVKHKKKIHIILF